MAQMQRLARFLLVCLSATLLGCHLGLPRAESERGDITPLNYLPVLSGDYFRIESVAVSRPFHIYVAYPDSYHKDVSARYPVVYLLDGDSLFPIHATYHRFLNYDERVPEAIVVGIAYGSFDPSVNKRRYDFSVSSESGSSGHGGALAFHEFLKGELIPEIDRRYRTNPDRRVLVGQSRGGYMVLYSAFVDPDLFWGRIASNPSFEPGRALFFSEPAPFTKPDLGLVVASGERDFASSREDAIDWFKAWDGRTDGAWRLKAISIPGGTHAADITNAYRSAMIWLFGDELQSNPR